MMLVRNVKMAMRGALDPTGMPENLLQSANFGVLNGPSVSEKTDTSCLLESGIGLFGDNFQLSGGKGQKVHKLLILKRCHIYPTPSIFRISGGPVGK